MSTLKHAMDGDDDEDDDDSSDDDFDLVVTKELKPGAMLPTEMNDDEDEDGDFEPNQEDEDDEDDEDETEAKEGEQVVSTTDEEGDESKKEGDESDNVVDKPEETNITDTFNEPLPQTMTLATDLPAEEDEAESSEQEEEETVELTEEEKEKQERKELAKKMALKKYIDDMKEEAKAAQAYMSDECEEEDDEGNVLDYKTFDDLNDMDEKEIEKEIGDFVTFSDSDPEAEDIYGNEEAESEITGLSDEEEDETMSMMSFGGDDDDEYDILGARRKKIVSAKLTPKQLAAQLEKNQENLKTLQRKDGGYGQFSSRGSKLLNMTLSKIAIPSTSKSDTKQEVERKERKEAEEKKKEAEKKQMEAYRNAIKKRKREIEKQSLSLVDNDEPSSMMPTPSLDSISSFSNSQELLSIMQSSTSKQGSQKGHKNTSSVSKPSFLNKSNHNQKAAKQFAAKQQKLQQKKSKESVSLFNSSVSEKPKKKKKTTKKK
ncbi:predicted protein [Naegleria gruberi]|uniref:Predicted protein n=1 Tax=Naegleria gruberi TaxID=5762 RepID=D2VAJ0_NAEGR|nr:uncharacterized protein NAEGRDRAFT_65875 [Naegleria gruberi]EFC46083.1 predicted protein [Naegleria gruberi]|eukprot:XP_002678827.1 predicted protein [Naegleria gruberi strain NEG-M]